MSKIYTFRGCLLAIFCLGILAPLQAQNTEEYYSGLEGLKGEELKAALHHKIKGHKVFPYTSSSTDVWDILKDTDEDPNNSNNIILIYTGRSEAKSRQDSGSGDSDAWNREHVWPKSHGFPNSSDTAYTDVHHLRPADRSVNTSRSNKDFDNGGSTQGEAPDTFTDSDSWEPRDEVKGDVARMMFYMATRYEADGEYDLELVNYTGTPSEPILGKLSTLLEWHENDPVDQWEISRNEKIYSYQGNRNPFVDHPEYAHLIWTIEDETFDGTLDEDFESCVAPGWTVYSVSSDKDWNCSGDGYAGGNCFEINGYQQAEPSEDWLITPKLGFSDYTEPVLVFMTETKYGSNAIELFISTDYDGSSAPASANWTALQAELPELNSATWEEVFIDLSAYKSDSLYIAFKYYSETDPARWRLDNVALKDAGAPNVAPELAGKLEDVKMNAGQELIVNINESLFTDENVYDELSYAVSLADGSELPAWLSFDETSSTLSGTPTKDDVATLEIKVTATDLEGLSASTTFMVTVEDAINVVLSENFDDCEPTGWIIQNISSDKNWECTAQEHGFENSSAFQINGYKQNTISEDWLISPAVSLRESPELTFQAATKYGSNYLELYVSSDYDGQSEPSTASWTKIDAELPQLNSDRWMEVKVDLAQYENEKVHIAFKYLATSDPARWTIDNILLTDKAANLLASDESLENNLVSFPNPAEGKLTVKAKSINAISLIDFNGRKVLHKNVQRSESQLSLDVSAFARGLYILKVTTDSGIETRKIQLK